MTLPTLGDDVTVAADSDSVDNDDVAADTRLSVNSGVTPVHASCHSQSLDLY